MATPSAGQGIISWIDPDKISTIVQLGPVAVLFSMFILTAYLLSKINSDGHISRAIIGGIYALSIVACGVTYYVSSKSEQIPTYEEVKKQFSSVAASFKDRPNMDKASINLGLREWATIMQARILVRQSLRSLCKSKDSRCESDLGIQHYAKRMNGQGVISSELLSQIMDFSNATYYVEWFDGQPNNEQIYKALDGADNLINKISSYRNP